MKKQNLIFSLVLLISMPIFSHTISVQRTLPANYDLSFAKNLSFGPAEFYSSKYYQEQQDIFKKFQAKILDEASNDKKFAVVSQNDGDIILKVKFTDFSITDNGVTLKNGDEVIKDEWTRNVHAELTFSVIKNDTNEVVYTRDFKSGLISPKVPRSQLPDAVKVFDYDPIVTGISLDIFDRPMYLPLTILDSKVKENKESFKTALNLCKKQKNYQEAANIYKDLYEAKKDPAAGFNYAMMLQALYDYDAETELLKKLLEINPKDNNSKKALERLPKDKENYETLKTRNQI